MSEQLPGNPLPPDQVALIQASFARLNPDPRIAERFYENLFRIAPDLRALFRPDMTGQGMRFMSTLRVIVQNLDAADALGPYLDKLAEGHAAYGVEAAHFRPMGQALIETMREALGDDFPEGAAAAWEAAYDHLATEMIRRGGMTG